MRKVVGRRVPTKETSTGPELRAFTAIELSWPSETNKRYRIQWTASLTQPQWQNLEPTALGTGANMSVFDSTREHPQGFYRLKIVQCDTAMTDL